eukprot:SAG11_NODE_6259_length_1350_cov_1.425260_1_plen_139_part_00
MQHVRQNNDNNNHCKKHSTSSDGAAWESRCRSAGRQWCAPKARTPKARTHTRIHTHTHAHAHSLHTLGLVHYNVVTPQVTHQREPICTPPHSSCVHWVTSAVAHVLHSHVQNCAANRISTLDLSVLQYFSFLLFCFSD